MTSISGTLVIESGRVVAKLLGRPNVHELSPTEQERFRRDAVALVTGHKTTPLVRALRRRIRSTGGPVIVVGIRNVSTLEGLRRSRTLVVRVLFLRAPFQLRVRRYEAREGGRALVYAKLLRARTEGEHAVIGDMADEVIDNGSDFRALERAIRAAGRWLAGRP